MTIFRLLAVLLALVIPAVIWMLLNREGSSVTSCIGCGECLRTGECTQVKKQRQRQAKKAAARLDKKDKTDIIISVKE